MLRVGFLLFFAFFFVSTEWKANDIAGEWQLETQDAHIKIYSSYGKFYGMVSWLKVPNDPLTGKPQLDIYNKDQSLRSRPLMHLLVIKDLVFNDKEMQWMQGTIYDPKTGNTYELSCRMIDKNNLEMHFYLAVQGLGKTSIWARITN